MKKLCYFFIFSLAILTTVLCFDEFNSFYFTKIRNLSSLVGDQIEKKDIGTYIPFNEENGGIEEVVDKVIKIADENNYTAVILKSQMGANESVESAYVYSKEFDIKKDVYLEKNIDIDFTSGTEEGYYTTDTSDEEAKDIMHLLSEDYINDIDNPIIYIKPLWQYKTDWKDDIDQPYVMFYSNDIEGIKHKIVDEFTGVSKDMIGSFGSDPATPKAISTSFELIVITVLTIILLLTCLINKSMKEISVRKMHGNSIRRIISSIFGSFFINGIIVFLLGLGITYWILVGEISPMAFNIIKMLSIVLGIFIIGYILLTLFIYGFIKVLSTALNMRKRHVNLTLVNINLILKFIMMVIIITPFLTIVQDGVRSGRELYEVNKYHDVEKYSYNISAIIGTGFHDDIEEVMNLGELQRKVMEVIDENGGIYFDTVNIQRDFDKVFLEVYSETKEEERDSIDLLGIGRQVYTKSYVPFILVNKNYLKDYEITLEDGSTLDLNSIDENTMIIPECRKHVNTSKYLEYSNGKQVPIIKVKDGMEYYNPAGDRFYQSRLIKDPVMLIYNEFKVNSGPSYNNNFFSDLEIMEEKLNEAGAKGRYETRNEAKKFEKGLKYNFRILVKGVVTLMLYTFILLVFLYQSVYLYMEETKRLISVQYVLGHGKLSRYSEIIVMNLAPHAFLFMISILFLSIPTKLIFTFCATFMFIEFLFMVYMIKKFERNTVIVVLKGE